MGQCWGLSTPTAHKGSVRVDLKPQIKTIDLDGALLWLGFGRGVRVVGSGDFGRFVVFLALWRALVACRLAVEVAASQRAVPGLI